ncbi:hypothetical protein RUND412_011275 [Rhizina undulata]
MQILGAADLARLKQCFKVDTGVIEFYRLLEKEAARREAEEPSRDMNVRIKEEMEVHVKAEMGVQIKDEIDVHVKAEMDVHVKEEVDVQIKAEMDVHVKEEMDVHIKAEALHDEQQLIIKEEAEVRRKRIKIKAEESDDDEVVWLYDRKVM